MYYREGKVLRVSAGIYPSLDPSTRHYSCALARPLATIFATRPKQNSHECVFMFVFVPSGAFSDLICWLRLLPDSIVWGWSFVD